MSWDDFHTIRACDESNVALARRYHDSGVLIAKIRRRQAWVNASERNRNDVPRAVVLATLALAGLRISGLCALDGDDPDFAGRRIYVPRLRKESNGQLVRVQGIETDAAERVLPMLPPLYDLLIDHKAEFGYGADDQSSPPAPAAATRSTSAADPRRGLRTALRPGGCVNQSSTGRRERLPDRSRGTSWKTRKRRARGGFGAFATPASVSGFGAFCRSSGTQLAPRCEAEPACVGRGQLRRGRSVATNASSRHLLRSRCVNPAGAGLRRRRQGCRGWRELRIIARRVVDVPPAEEISRSDLTAAWAP